MPIVISIFPISRRLFFPLARCQNLVRFISSRLFNPSSNSLRRIWLYRKTISLTSNWNSSYVVISALLVLAKHSNKCSNSHHICAFTIDSFIGICMETKKIQNNFQIIFIANYIFSSSTSHYYIYHYNSPANTNKWNIDSYGWWPSQPHFSRNYDCSTRKNPPVLGTLLPWANFLHIPSWVSLSLSFSLFVGYNKLHAGPGCSVRSVFRYNTLSNIRPHSQISERP